MPLVIFMPGRNESNLAGQGSEAGPRQAFDEALAFVARRLLKYDEEVHRRTKAIFSFALASCQNGLCRHAVSGPGAALHSIKRRDADEGRRIAVLCWIVQT